jgi:hypothetical protein
VDSDFDALLKESDWLTMGSEEPDDTRYILPTPRGRKRITVNEYLDANRPGFRREVDENGDVKWVFGRSTNMKPADIAQLFGCSDEDAVSWMMKWYAIHANNIVWKKGGQWTTSSFALRRYAESIPWPGPLDATIIHPEPLKPADPADARVYFLFSAGTNRVKIGWSSRPAVRIYAIQTGSPDKLTVRYMEPGTKDDEKQYHRRFSKYREHREWFRLEGELADFLASVEAKP